MKNQQTINCDVCDCTHHCKKSDCCKLSAITVSPDQDNKKCSFCKDYKEKSQSTKK